ncbi:MAG TPA: DUF1761 domain-containing protein [Caulobacteraceae bacterium]|jgi:hypothetical protein|nr:DUF1761 domain-containing protein [Caulobacteraceae bacterium]
MLQGLNWVGVIVALVVSQVASWLWYGMLFADKLSQPMSPAAKTPMGYAEGALFSLVMLIGIAWVIRRTNRESLMAGLVTGAFLWFVFPFMGACLNWLYMGEPTSMLEIDGGFTLVYFLIAGALIGGVKLRGKAV